MTTKSIENVHTGVHTKVILPFPWSVRYRKELKCPTVVSESFGSPALCLPGVLRVDVSRAYSRVAEVAPKTAAASYARAGRRTNRAVDKLRLKPRLALTRASLPGRALHRQGPAICSACCPLPQQGQVLHPTCRAGSNALVAAPRPLRSGLHRLHHCSRECLPLQ